MEVSGRCNGWLSYLALGDGGRFDGTQRLVDHVHEHLLRQRMRSHMPNATAAAALPLAVGIFGS